MPLSLESNNDYGQHRHRLNRYLDDVSKPLPEAEREPWRTEASQHLEAMIRAYEELGYGRSEAVTLAIERFGAAESLGFHLREEANKGHRWSAFRGNFVNLITPVFLCFTGLGIVCLIYSETGSESLHAGLMTAGRTLPFVAPLLAGGWMGYRLSRGSSLRDMLIAVFCTLPYCLIPLMMFVTVSDYGWVLSLPKIVVPLLLWLPLAVIGALVTRELFHGERAVREQA